MLLISLNLKFTIANKALIETFGWPTWLWNSGWYEQLRCT